MIESLKNITIGEILKNGIPYESQNIPQSLKQNMRDKEILKPFLKKYFGDKYYLYLNNVNYQAITNEDFEKKSTEFMEAPESMQPDLFWGGFNDLLEGKIDPTIKNNLIKKPGNPIPASYFNQTPLYLACKEQNEKIVEILLKKGANPNLSCHNSYPVHHVINNPTISKLFFQCGLDINTLDILDDSLLDRAIYFKSIEFVKLLLENELDDKFINQSINYIKNLMNDECIDACDITIYEEISNLLKTHLEKKQQGSTLIIINGDVEPIQNSSQTTTHSQ